MNVTLTDAQRQTIQTLLAQEEVDTRKRRIRIEAGPQTMGSIALSQILRNTEEELSTIFDILEAAK